MSRIYPPNSDEYIGYSDPSEQKVEWSNVNKIISNNTSNYKIVDFKSVAIAYINENICVNDEDNYIIINTDTREILDFRDINLDEINDERFLVLKKIK